MEIPDYAAWGIPILLFVVFVIILIIKSKRGHKHRFRIADSFVIGEHPRLLQLCRCGTAIHTPIYTLKQLKEVENNG